jgi:esterase
MPTDHFITLNDMRFRYREWGEQSAEPIVLLHGVLVNADTYDGIAARLGALGRRVLVLDQRGHGQSDYSSDYSWRTFVADLEAFWGALRLGSVDVVGHSMGGHHARRFAALHPDSVSRLVIIEAPVAPDVPWETLPYLEAIAQLSPPTGYASRDEFVDVAMGLFPRSERDSLVAQSQLLANGDGRLNWQWRPDLSVFGAQDGAPSVEDEWQLCGRVRCPVMVMRAAHSELFDPAELERNVGAFPSGVAVELPNSGHNVMWENPSGVADLVDDFITSRG